MPVVPIARVLPGTRLTSERSNHGWWVAAGPVAHLRQTTPQSIASGGSFKAVIFGHADEDTDPDGVGGHSTTMNPSRYTARYPGIYRVSGGVSFAANTAGSRGCAWLRNGSVIDGSDVMIPAVTSASTASRVPARSMLIRLQEGDYLELGAFHNAGSALDTVTGSAASSMSIEWVRL